MVNFVRTKEGEHLETMSTNASDHTQLNFAAGTRGDFGIWSIRFSADAREIVAGASHGDIFLYDIERGMSNPRIEAHDDDVNAVDFADKSSSNVLVSGSDDSFIKVWDRRSMRGQTPSGVLVGHTEGITFVSSKGDGRYVVSNGKDQTAKLWDLRMMYSAQVSKLSRLSVYTADGYVLCRLLPICPFATPASAIGITEVVFTTSPVSFLLVLVLSFTDYRSFQSTESTQTMFLFAPTLVTAFFPPSSDVTFLRQQLRDKDTSILAAPTDVFT